MSTCTIANLHVVQENSTVLVFNSAPWNFQTKVTFQDKDAKQEEREKTMKLSSTPTTKTKYHR